MIPPRYNRFQCAAALLQQWIVIIVAALALVTFPKAEAQTTNSNVILGFDILATAGAPGTNFNGPTSGWTNTNGVLTNGYSPFATANNIVYSNSTTGVTNTPLIGVSDTAMTVYGFASKASTSTKGFILYQNTLTVSTSTNINPINNSNYAILAAPTTTNEAQAIAQDSLITWSITVSPGYRLVLTNASGWTAIGGSGNGVSNYGFIFSTNVTFNNGQEVFNSYSNIGIASVAVGATTALAPSFASSLTVSNLVLNTGTYYFGVAWWGAASSGTASTVQGTNLVSDFNLLGYSVALPSAMLTWLGGSLPWTARNWADSNGFTASWDNNANLSATLTNGTTNPYNITLDNGTVTANSVIVSNTTGTITLGSGTLNTLSFTVSGTGTLQLLQSNMFSNTMGFFPNSGTVDLGSNSQVVGLMVLGGGTVTGSGTLTPTSLTMSSGQILAPLAGSYAPAQSGAGTTELDGTNTFTGSVTVSQGVLKIGSTYALGSGTYVTVNSTNASLDLAGQAPTLKTLIVGASGNTNQGALNNSSSNQATWSGPLSNNTAGSVTYVTAGLLGDYSQPYGCLLYTSPSPRD